MSSSSVHAIGRAMRSSALVGGVRRVVAGSVVCALVATANQRLRRVRERIIAGLGGEWTAERETRSTEHIVALVSGSRLMAGLSSAGNAPLAAWQGSTLRYLLDPMLGLDLTTRVRFAGWVIVIAVITHAVLSAMLDVHVEAVGWSVRAGLVTAGLAVMAWPRALASAWEDWAAKRKRSSAGI